MVTIKRNQYKTWIVKSPRGAILCTNMYDAITKAYLLAKQEQKQTSAAHDYLVGAMAAVPLALAFTFIQAGLHAVFM